jgi:LmbE family N-acetylglucosaminyl deacetylase
VKALAISVHPDDETLGCGGTLLKLAKGEATLHWLIVTRAQMPDFGREQVLQQAAQVEAVRAAYQFATIDWLDFPAAKIDQVALDELVKSIREVIARIRPELVFVPNRADVHSDHQICFQAVQAVLKAFYQRSLGIQRVMACEVLSETDAAMPMPETAFLPNVFVDISETFPAKLQIMELYESELHPELLPRSASAIEAQARLRGATIGVKYAEAFMLLREII